MNTKAKEKIIKMKLELIKDLIIGFEKGISIFSLFGLIKRISEQLEIIKKLNSDL